MNAHRKRPPLRERVAMRARGELPPDKMAEVEKSQRMWRLVAIILQGVGLAMLAIYALILYQQGFASLDYRMLILSTFIFICGRGIHLWLYFMHRRR